MIKLIWDIHKIYLHYPYMRVKKVKEFHELVYLVMFKRYTIKKYIYLNGN